MDEMNMEVLSMAGAHDPSPPNLISEMALDRVTQEFGRLRKKNIYILLNVVPNVPYSRQYK